MAKLQLMKLLPDLRIGIALPPGIAGIIGNLLMAKLSRRDEYEADEYASALLIKSGIGVEPQISMFKKLEKISVLEMNIFTE